MFVFSPAPVFSCLAVLVTESQSLCHMTLALWTHQLLSIWVSVNFIKLFISRGDSVYLASLIHLIPVKMHLTKLTKGVASACEPFNFVELDWDYSVYGS